MSEPVQLGVALVGTEQADTAISTLEGRIDEVGGRVSKTWDNIKERFDELVHLEQRSNEIIRRVDLSIAEKGEQLANLKQRGIMAAQQIMSLVQTGYSLLNNIMSAFGATFDAVTQATVSFVFSAFSAMFSIALGMLGNPLTAIQGGIAMANAVINYTRALQAAAKARNASQAIRAPRTFHATRITLRL